MSCCRWNKVFELWLLITHLDTITTKNLLKLSNNQLCLNPLFQGTGQFVNLVVCAAAQGFGEGGSHYRLHNPPAQRSCVWEVWPPVRGSRRSLRVPRQYPAACSAPSHSGPGVSAKLQSSWLLWVLMCLNVSLLLPVFNPGSASIVDHIYFIYCLGPPVNSPPF